MAHRSPRSARTGADDHDPNQLSHALMPGAVGVGIGRAFAQPLCGGLFVLFELGHELGDAIEAPFVT